MKKTIIFFLCIVASSYNLEAQIFCPDDVTVSCLSDLTPNECGMATVVSGNYHPSMIKYVDENETNACNEGIVYRKFYLDIDYSNTFTENEPSCTQIITMVYSSLPLNIQFPSDKEYTCLDEVPVDSPTWSSNPCDLVGYTYEDEVFEFETGACLKIVRTYTVINWCVYDVNSVDGLITGIQIIKIIDEVAPEIDNCEDQHFDTGANCEALVTLTNSASDTGDCPSGTLTWRVSVDLWADGTDDLVYGPYEPAPFRLDPVSNGANVEIEIPEALTVSKHKVVWKVTDGCGNVRSCSSEFFVEDNKPPTPYCLSFTSAALNGDDEGQITIPASFFNVDAVDNCSSKESIILSFSENVEDTEKIIECGDTGFKFYRIYYTDEAGNQDFCEVFMLILDNGTCFGKYAPSGSLLRPNGTPIEDASAYLMEEDQIISLVGSDVNGVFNFGEQDLMEVYSATIKKEDGGFEDVDIEDFIKMRSALIGKDQLDFYQKIAADINQDNSFDSEDLYAFRDVLLNKAEIAAEDLWTFVPMIHNVNTNEQDLDTPESISYTSYNQGFDFYGIRTGDITGSKYGASDVVKEENEIGLTIEITNDAISIIANHDFESDAYQFDLLVDPIEFSDEQEDVASIRINDAIRYVNVESSEAVSKGQALLYISVRQDAFKSIDDIIKSAKIFQKGAVNPSSVKWNIIDKRDTPNSFISRFDLNVYPLPMVDNLNIDAANISKVSLFTITGDRVYIDTTIDQNGAVLSTKNNLQRGVYFLKVTANGEEQVVKIVR